MHTPCGLCGIFESLIRNSVPFVAGDELSVYMKFPKMKKETSQFIFLTFQNGILLSAVLKPLQCIKSCDKKY